jgi:NAD(P)-dependent dehydrogenase (short-subunit alcohol dehydrogenase family)
MPSFGDFIHTQLVLKIPKPSVNFSQKTVIVTGASGGLGKEITKHIVILGASKVILACRNTSKGEETKASILKTLKCRPEVLEVWNLDLESPVSVKKFADRVNELPRLDVLINNAGMQTMQFRVAYDTEKTIAVNVIGTFLLAIQLIPKMRETAKTYSVTPHMTFTGSALYDVAKYPEGHGDNIFAWLGDKDHANMMNE